MFIEPEDIIDFCYEALLQRPAESQGKQYYLEQLKSGQSFQQVVQSFLNSSEFKQLKRSSEPLENEKREFLLCLYQYLLKRQPSQIELESWLKVPFHHQELLLAFAESEEYQNLNKSILEDAPEHLYGVMVNSDDINAYLLYPAFDQVQLKASLAGNPFQLSDFLACMNFLRNRQLVKTEKHYFLDLGSNIGSSSIYALKGGYFDHAISIEASALNYQFLTFNTQINQLTDRLQTFNYALADFIGEGELVCNPDNCGDFRIQPDHSSLQSENLFNEDNYTRELSEFTTLDELMRRGVLEPEEIGFVWIDCQGSEGLIFKGGKQFFGAISVPLYVEFWPYGINRLAGKESYFDFISHYSSNIWRLVEGEFEQTSINFLEEFYDNNIATGDYIDILATNVNRDNLGRSSAS